MPRTFRRFLICLLVVSTAFYGLTVLAAYTPLMQRTLHAEIVVNAPAAVVWQVLTRLDEYKTWNPFLRRASGVVAVGERLRLEAHLGADTLIFTPTVLEVQPNRELRWLGQVLLPGIFDGEHSFTLTPLGENRVRVVQQETFRGVVVPFSRTLLGSTEAAFGALNTALKTRAEQQASR